MRPMTKAMLIRALGLYAILALGAVLTLDDSRIRSIAVILVLAMAAKTGIAYLAQER